MLQRYKHTSKQFEANTSQINSLKHPLYIIYDYYMLLHNSNKAVLSQDNCQKVQTLTKAIKTQHKPNKGYFRAYL